MFQSAPANKKTFAVLTQVLNVLISGKRDDATLRSGARPIASAKSLVDNDTVGRSRGDEGQAVGVTGPSRVEVQGQVGDGVAGDTEQRGEVPGGSVSMKSRMKLQL